MCLRVKLASKYLSHSFKHSKFFMSPVVRLLAFPISPSSARALPAFSSPLFLSSHHFLDPKGCIFGFPWLSWLLCSSCCCSRATWVYAPCGGRIMPSLKCRPLGCMVTPCFKPVPHDTPTLCWKLRVEPWGQLSWAAFKPLDPCTRCLDPQSTCRRDLFVCEQLVIESNSCAHPLL